MRRLFEDAESIAIASASVIFFLEIPDRKKREQYEAWQVINSAHEQTGNGGRIQALEDLNKGKVDLEGVAAPRAELSRIRLANGRLNRARLNEAQLDRAQFSYAKLGYADLSRANLESADLLEASLYGANLSGAILLNANLRGACLSYANLRSAKLGGVRLQGAKLNHSNLSNANFCQLSLEHRERELRASGFSDDNIEQLLVRFSDLYFSPPDLSGADLQNACLSGANLGKANLKDVNLSGANLKNADFSGVINVTQSQLSSALLCSTMLPPGIKLNPDRNCENLDKQP